MGVKRVQGAVRTVIGGVAFDSRREARRWADLLLLQRAGAIRDLDRQVSIPLCGRNGPILTPTGRQMIYRADFQYFDTEKGKWVVEDSKGFATEVYKMKRAILAAQGLNVVEV